MKYLFILLLFSIPNICFSQFTFSENNWIKTVFKQIQSASETDLIQVHKSHSKKHIFLLVEGLPDGRVILKEWYRPFASLAKHDFQTYYQKLNKRVSIYWNSKVLAKNLTALRSRHPESKIIVVGFSTGGVVLLNAMEQNFIQLNHKTRGVTVASPIGGFGFGGTSILVSPFIGKLTVEMGRGLKLLTHSKRQFNYCSHYINLNCNKDPVACRRNGVHSQLRGYTPEADLLLALDNYSDMPCGRKNSFTFDMESHQSIVDKVIQKLLGTTSRK